jgi:prepilin signal peptidase PulO-like enzyme (type II secretory pathway)
MLLATALIDLRSGVVYWWWLGPAVLAAVVVSAVTSGPANAFLGVVSATAVLFAVYAVGRGIYRGRRPIGEGDIGIAALVGSTAGFPAGIIGVLIGSVLNGGVAALTLGIAGARRESLLPFGPGLCLGGALALWLTQSD